MQVTKYDSMIPVSELKVHDLLVTATDTQYISSISAERRSGEFSFNFKQLGSNSRSSVERQLWSDPFAKSLKFYMPVTLVRYSDGYFDLINDSMREFRKSLNSIKNSSPYPVGQVVYAVRRIPDSSGLFSGLVLFISNKEINLHSTIEALVREKLDNCLWHINNRESNYAQVHSYDLAKCILAGEGIEELSERRIISNTARAEAHRLQQVANDAWKV